jgi:hypothetical protein
MVAWQEGASPIAERYFPASGVEPASFGLGSGFYSYSTAIAPQLFFYPDGSAIGVFAAWNGATYYLFYNEFR